MKRKVENKIAVILFFACIISLFPVHAYAAAGNSRTLRVGFFAFDGYHVQDGDGNRSGYGYDFLQLLARYGDWTYEYVGYDKSWAEMQDNQGLSAVSRQKKNSGIVSIPESFYGG